MAGTAEGAAKARARRAAKRTEAPSPVAVRQAAPKPAREPVYLVGRKPIKHGKKTYQPGEYFPLARRLPRLESWLRTGALVVK
jgi:hypothetical protein